MKNLLIALILFNINFLYSAEKDPIVAKVNGKEIRKSELYQYHQDNLKYARALKKVTLESSLNDLINREIGVDRAKKNKLDKVPHVVKKMEDILYHAQISKDLENKLKEIKVSDNEVKEFYKNNPEYRTAQILLRQRAVPDKEEVKKLKELEVQIYNEVTKSPDKFLEIAERFNQANSATRGGDLGYQPRTRLTPEFYAAIKGKKVGTITKPFKTQFGRHIVKVLGVKTYDQIDKGMYKKIIYDIKRDKMIEDYFQGLRKKSSVKVYSKNLR
jgi:parvulin-like peptidyl-prolyl isomerase